MTSSRISVRRAPKLRHILPLLALALPLVTPGVAFAGGYEIGTPGARAEGRGGAEVAATDNSMALYFNPANLARVDRVSLFASGHLIFQVNCMRREIAELTAGDPYAPADEAAAASPDASGRFFLPETCDQARPTIIPNLGVTIPIMDGLTLGVGLHFPVSPQIINFGGENGMVETTGGMLIPTPTRYLMTERDVIQAYPMVGFGYAPMDELRVGFTFGSGITSVEFTNYAFSGLLMDDARNELYVKDWFNPRITASVAATPMPGLDVAFAYTWVGDVEADGHLGIDAGIAQAEIDDVTLNSPQNWNVAFAARYFKPLANPVGQVGDRLATEAWDIEVDFLIYGNERVDSYTVDLPDDAMLSVLPLPDSLALPHNWNNQFVVRVGGDYNVVPGMLAVRGGFSFESDGVDDGWEQLDFQPFRRFGLHVGGTWRIGDRIDLSAAYTHLFQDEIDNLGVDCLNTPDLVNQPRCQQRPTSSVPPTAAEASVANAGIIRSAYNMVAIEASYNFGPRGRAAVYEEEPAPVEEDVGVDVDVEPTPYQGDVPPPEPAPEPTY